MINFEFVLRMFIIFKNLGFDFIIFFQKSVVEYFIIPFENLNKCKYKNIIKEY